MYAQISIENAAIDADGYLRMKHRNVKIGLKM